MLRRLVLMLLLLLPGLAAAQGADKEQQAALLDLMRLQATDEANRLEADLGNADVFLFHSDGRVVRVTKAKIDSTLAYLQLAALLEPEAIMPLARNAADLAGVPWELVEPLLEDPDSFLAQSSLTMAYGYLRQEADRHRARVQKEIVKLRRFAVALEQQLKTLQAAATELVPKGGPVFEPPTVDGFFVDYCLNAASDCGAATANVFCQQRGYAKAKEYLWGPIFPTVQLTSGAICNQDNCGGFLSITCE